jgi:SpoVK/Ycf46/Vps4 family AAA+-type ATPase
MARGDILRKLFKSFSQEDREAFYAAATQLIEEEKNKNHLLLAKDLESIIKKKSSNGYASNYTPNYYPEVPTDKDSGLPLIEVRTYEYSLERVVLSSDNLEIIERIIIENRKKEILNSYGLKPISKILFCGFPGCGKTLTAKVLSGVLELPLVYVNLSSVFSSYLGETAVNLKKIFDYVKQGEWLVFFDEFDAIAKDRNSPNEHGEIQRLVNSLLQLIDNSNEQSIFIAATNYESLLDRAVWRRFDEVILFGKPDYNLRISLLKNNLSSIRYSDIDFQKIASSLEGVTGSDIEKICLDAIKSVILKNKNNLTEVDLNLAIRRYMERKSIVDKSTRYIKDLISIKDGESV